jgi:hypothetical protein
METAKAPVYWERWAPSASRTAPPIATQARDVRRMASAEPVRIQTSNIIQIYRRIPANSASKTNGEMIVDKTAHRDANQLTLTCAARILVNVL